MQHPTPSQPICTSSSKGSWALSGDVPCPEHRKDIWFWYAAIFHFLFTNVRQSATPHSRGYFNQFLSRNGSFCAIHHYKNYLSPVKNYHSSHGYELHLSNFLRLRLILRGIKHSQGHQSKERRPITSQLLNVFYHLLNVQRTDNRDSLMFWAPTTFAFFGFLRIGELTLNSTFDPKLHLMNRHNFYAKEFTPV